MYVCYTSQLEPMNSCLVSTNDLCSLSCQLLEIACSFLLSSNLQLCIFLSKWALSRIIMLAPPLLKYFSFVQKYLNLLPHNNKNSKHLKLCALFTSSNTKCWPAVFLERRISWFFIAPDIPERWIWRVKVCQVVTLPGYGWFSSLLSNPYLLQRCCRVCDVLYHNTITQVDLLLQCP